MATTELIPTLPGRPAVLKKDGCTYFISVHDAEFLRVRAEWKRKLKELHPDTASMHGNFIAAVNGYRMWQQKEAVWYAEVGIDPPIPIKLHSNFNHKALRLEARAKRYVNANCVMCGKEFQSFLYYGTTKAKISERTVTCSQYCGGRLSKANQMGLTPKQYVSLRLAQARGREAEWWMRHGVGA